MRTGAWWKLAREGRFDFHPTRIPMAAIVSMLAPLNDMMGGLQSLFHGRRIANTELAGPPVFILGHWRSGTTLLHELLVRDESWSYPTSFQCFAPHHFLLTEWQFNLFGSWLVPSKRPMDNMAAGWRLPQEDEFALLALGLPSPYRRMAFPNHSAPDLNYLDWTGITPDEHRLWTDSLKQFMQAVTYKTGKPLVLKSPTHTGRVGRAGRSVSRCQVYPYRARPAKVVPVDLSALEIIGRLAEFSSGKARGPGRLCY